VANGELTIRVINTKNRAWKSCIGQLLPLLQDTSRYSCSAVAAVREVGVLARKIFYRCEKEGNHRFLILRNG